MKYANNLLLAVFFLALFITPFSAYSKSCCCDFSSKKANNKSMPCHAENDKQVTNKTENQKKECNSCMCKIAGVGKIFISKPSTGFYRVAKNIEHFYLKSFSFSSRSYSIFTPPKFSA